MTTLETSVILIWAGICAVNILWEKKIKVEIRKKHRKKHKKKRKKK